MIPPRIAQDLIEESVLIIIFFFFSFFVLEKGVEC